MGHFMDSSGREFEGSSNLPILINQTSSAQEELFKDVSIGMCFATGLSKLWLCDMHET